jgi:hypothetical protein
MMSPRGKEMQLTNFAGPWKCLPVLNASNTVTDKDLDFRSSGIACLSLKLRPTCFMQCSPKLHHVSPLVRQDKRWIALELAEKSGSDGM